VRVQIWVPAALGGLPWRGPRSLAGHRTRCLLLTYRPRGGSPWFSYIYFGRHACKSSRRLRCEQLMPLARHLHRFALGAAGPGLFGRLSTWDHSPIRHPAGLTSSGPGLGSMLCVNDFKDLGKARRYAMGSSSRLFGFGVSRAGSWNCSPSPP